MEHIQTVSGTLGSLPKLNRDTVPLPVMLIVLLNLLRVVPVEPGNINISGWATGISG